VTAMIGDDHPALDHAVIHRDAHAAAVRVVSDEDVGHTVEELEMLFPHDIVLITSLGCCHTCVYTHTASAAVVAERIAEHLRDVEHRPEK
jgi:hypothetical protein